MKRRIEYSISANAGDGTTTSSVMATCSSSSSIESLFGSNYNNQIGVSMKRMKISMSPGELRLNKDMEQLQTLENPWTPPSVNDSNSRSIINNNGNGLLHLISPNQRAQIQRDPVEPLKCSIAVYFLPHELPPPLSNIGKHHNETIGKHKYAEQWTYLLQFPRMYPHSPPKIHRITTAAINPRSLETVTMIDHPIHNDNETKFVQQLSRNNDNQKPPSNPTQNHPCCRNGIPLLENIEISSSLPSLSNRYNTNHDLSSNSSNRNQPEDKDVTWSWRDGMRTTNFENWSPVSTLGDIVQLLMQLPLQRRQSWYQYNQSQQRQQQHNQRLGKNQNNNINNLNNHHGVFEEPATILTRTVSLLQDEVLLPSSRDFFYHDETRETNNNSINRSFGNYDTCMIDSSSMRSNDCATFTTSVSLTTGTKHNISFPPNRFNVGYNTNDSLGAVININANDMMMD